jgi:hypothetical protein
MPDRKPNEHLSMRDVDGRRIAVAWHEAGSRDLVVFCHGFRGHKGGPNSFFVGAARQLAAHGVCSLRFDQPGSGDSEGSFEDSSFDEWLATTAAIVREHQAAGYRVALFGQSMGGAAVLAVAAEVTGLVAEVAWVPDPNVDPFEPSPTGFCEEGGQIVQDRFWREAHEARIAERLPNVAAPAYLVFGTADEFVSEENRLALTERARPHHRIDVFEGYAHSAWTHVQATEIIDRSCRFLVEAFARAGGRG